MKLLPSMFRIPAAAVTLTMLCAIAGCGTEDSPAPESMDGPADTAGVGNQVPAGGPVTPATGPTTPAGEPTAPAGEPTTPAGEPATPAGGPVTMDAVPATFETFKFVVTEVPCFGAGCHNDEQNPLNLQVDDQLYTRVTSGISVKCGNLPIVNPGNPQESAIVKILKGPCGSTPRMPLGCLEDQDANCVPAEYIAAIEQWIAAGAPQL